MRTRIISAFPGTGKTYSQTRNSDKKIVDLDSNNFTSGHDSSGKVISEGFPSNYIQAISEHISKSDILFISIHREVREMLANTGIDFTLVYPKRELKEEYLERFRERGDSGQFVELFSKNWDAILKELESQKNCKHVVLGCGEYITDVLSGL
jgi:hypothetical protein